MKGDVAFVGFVLTAEDWHALDAQSRAQLVAVATRRVEPWPTGALAEGTGPHEREEVAAQSGNGQPEVDVRGTSEACSQLTPATTP